MEGDEFGASAFADCSLFVKENDSPFDEDDEPTALADVAAGDSLSCASPSACIFGSEGRIFIARLKIRLDESLRV
jgi:hypothetical protein